MERWTVDSIEITKQANHAKEVFLDALILEDILTASDVEKIKKRYVLILAKPSWFGRIFKGKEEYFWKVVKLMGSDDGQFK